MIAPQGTDTQKGGNNRSLPAAPAKVDIKPSSSETIVRTVTERPESPETGTPGKGGSIKIYLDAGDLEDAEARVMNAFKVRDLANRLISPETLSQRMQA